MLEERDIQQIGMVVEKSIMPKIGLEIDKAFDERLMPKIALEMGRVIEDNVIPAIDELREEIEKMRTEMVTKSYLDDKLADLEGGLLGKLRKEDGKVNHLIEMLKSKSILSEQEVQQFKEYQVFPKLERV